MLTLVGAALVAHAAFVGALLALVVDRLNGTFDHRDLLQPRRSLRLPPFSLAGACCSVPRLVLAAAHTLRLEAC